MGIWYATVEAVRDATDSASSGRDTRRIMRALEGASRSIDGNTWGTGWLARRFYPQIGTYYFDRRVCRSKYTDQWVLDLSPYELAGTPTAITAGGVTIDPASVFLLPQEGPPYDEIQLNRDVYGAWPTSGTGQRDVLITGPWGFNLDWTPTTTLAGAISDSALMANFASGAGIGTGSLLQLGDEWTVVTIASWLASGETLAADLAESTADDTVAATADPGELLLVGSERLRVLDVAASGMVVVERAALGSTLAAHSTGDAIYAMRKFGLSRAALGTTAASHADGDAVDLFEFPGPVEQLCIAAALAMTEGETAAYASVAGSGESAHRGAGGNLAAIIEATQATFGRTLFVGA